MQEEAPTRQVGYRGPDGTVTYIDEPLKWINPTGKTAEQVLLEIGDMIYECRRKKQDVEDLLRQASSLLWREFQDDQNSIYAFVKEQLDYLSKYDKQRSQRTKDSLLEEIAKESRFRIEHYFKMGDA